MEVAGYISHDTAFVRTRDVAQIRYFEQLLGVVSRKHPVVVYSTNALVCQDDLQQLGRRVECYHADQTVMRLGADPQNMSVTDLVELVVVKQIGPMYMDQSTPTARTIVTQAKGSW